MSSRGLSGMTLVVSLGLTMVRRVSSVMTLILVARGLLRLYCSRRF